MKLIVLDRDGTINHDRDDFVKSAEEWAPLPGSLEAIAKLNHGGWRVMIATNQSGLGRGLFDLSTLIAMHAKMSKLLAAAGGRIDAVFFCPHAPEDECNCRKPLPGLFNQIIERTGVPAGQILCVGDSLRDAQAAASAGCQPFLVQTGKGAHYATQPLAADFPAQTKVFADLPAFAQWVLAGQGAQTVQKDIDTEKK